MKKSIVVMLVSTVLLLATSVTTFAAGSISSGTIDVNEIKVENGDVEFKRTDGVTYAQDVQVVVDAINGIDKEDKSITLGNVISPLTNQKIDRYWWKDVDVYNVDLNEYKFLSDVYEGVLIAGDPSVTPVIVRFPVNNLTDTIDADVLHYCNQHGWEILNGVEKVSEKLLEVEYHSFSPSVIIYKEKQKPSIGGWTSPSFWPTPTPVPVVTAVPVVAPVDKDDVVVEESEVTVEPSEESVVESSEESVVESSEESVVDSSEESGVPAGAEAEGSGSVLPIVLIAAVLVAIGIFLIIFLKKKKNEE